MTALPLANAASNGILRKDTSDLLVMQPMISMNALFMRHENIAAGKPDDVAATNGSSVFIWPRYYEYKASDRLGILLHEYLHAAFAHPLRAVKLKQRYREAFRMDVLNIAADAIINKGIEISMGRTSGPRKTSNITLPDGLVELDEIVKQAKAIVALTGVDVDTDRMSKIDKLTLEWLYAMMMRLREAATEYECQAANDNADNDGQQPQNGSQTPGDAQQELQKKNRERNEQELRNYLETIQTPADIIISELDQMSQSDIDDAIRDAAEKLRNGIAMNKDSGMSRANIIETLAGDIPRVNTPWETSFRSITQRHLARVPVRRPTLPGRHVLTQEALGLQRIMWSAARCRPPVPRVVVVLDSSGSVQPAEYKRYLGEVQAMKRRTNAEVFVIVADMEVQGVFEIKDVKAVADVQFTGRGGTDFRPALAVAAEMQADLVVYLTDLMGTFPDQAPPMPVIWTLTADEIPASYKPPFGRVIHVQ